jgi:hypothetical protein
VKSAAEIERERLLAAEKEKFSQLTKKKRKKKRGKKERKKSKHFIKKERRKKILFIRKIDFPRRERRI